MTNREKYAKEILDIVCAGEDIAVKNGEPCECDKIECSECDLSARPNCDVQFVKWCKAECDNISGGWQEQMASTFLGDSRK